MDLHESVVESDLSEPPAVAGRPLSYQDFDNECLGPVATTGVSKAIRTSITSVCARPPAGGSDMIARRSEIITRSRSLLSPSLPLPAGDHYGLDPPSQCRRGLPGLR